MFKSKFEADAIELSDTQPYTYQKNMSVLNQRHDACQSSFDLGIYADADGVLRSIHDTQVGTCSIASQIDRTQMLAAKDVELSAKMTDFQKAMLNDIERSFVGHSKLIDESMKHK